ncbi:MAG: TonB-dependent receptor [Polyangia bacterium]|jgi:hypothetical protein
MKRTTTPCAPGGNRARRYISPTLSLAAGLTLLPTTARAGGVQTLQPVEVTDSVDNLVGSADSSTEGTLTQKDIEARPLMRTAELLEGIPGFNITQHSGEGKANQYYLRGFNLDHGTDFAITVDDMPVNMPTHAHGQGYCDLNFLIPELLSGLQYRKGPYYADEGDFSAVGAAHLDYQHELDGPLGVVTLGNDGYERGLVAASVDLLKGKLLVGVEALHDNGPWVNPDNYEKLNAILRYTNTFGRNAVTVDLMAYDGKWNATNQTADRAIDEGLVSRFGTLDPSDQGKSYRYSLSAQWQHTEEKSLTKLSAYGIGYGMDLYNDFTYFLENPSYGDQFHQKDRRIIVGLRASQTWFDKFLGRDMDNTIGLQVRNDFIMPVALYATDQTAYQDTAVQDNVTQLNAAPYFQNRVQWTNRFRTVAGLRWDYFNFDVRANIPQNSGNLSADIGSPKLSMIFGPWANTELFLNGGYGFHSNDARVATEKIDPQYNLPQTTLPALERAIGSEVGTRTAIIPHLQNELTLWYLHLASEQIFDGDHGVTTPSYPSHRYGVESANYYTPYKWLTVDADIAYSVPVFEDDPVGNRIPGSPTWVVSAGAAVDDIRGLFASARMHYFGARPLIDNDAVESTPNTVVDARVGYKLRGGHCKGWRVWIDYFNVANAKVSDIEFYYTSRLPGEPPAGVNDIHTHPENSFLIRANLKAVF